MKMTTRPPRSPDLDGKRVPRQNCLRAARPAPWITAFLLLLWVGSTVGELRGAPHRPSQYDVEAVYLYDFGKFVRWPASTTNRQLEICVAGNEAYEEALEKIVAGEHIDGHSVSVLHIERPQDESGCAILFIDTSAQDRLDILLAAVSEKPTLTVSDMPGFLDRGGMIQFVLADHRVRFAVNLKPATACGLSLSSELLKVAINVSGRQTVGGAP